MIAHTAEIGNVPALVSLALALADFVDQAVKDALPAHQFELQLWKHMLALGYQTFAQFLAQQGTGDLGPNVALPDGSTAKRLPELHSRDYRTVFGKFVIPRTCYGSREGQKITFVPLDNRLQLPESDYSYLLQEWNQTLGCEASFDNASAALQKILDFKQPVDSLERINRQMADAVEPFRNSRPLPEAKAEGALFVLSGDGKGVVIRREPGDPQPKAHRNKGDKANKKRMSIVGAIYSVDRYVRTPEEVVAALFRDPRDPDKPKVGRPEPVGKHRWARLSQAKDGSLGEPIDAVFGWQAAELKRRDPDGIKEVVCLMDGQGALWDGKERHFPERTVEILDLLHVAPRLWQAGHLFHKEGSVAVREFVRERLLRVLQGESKGVVSGLRRMGTLRGLSGDKKKKLRTLCNYLASNESRMRYDEYLKKGYPVASGVIEGACRHYVKDRMERSGMRWTKAGAQAMLDVRSEYLNGDWEAFGQFRIAHETERLYPHRGILDSVPQGNAA